MRSIELLRSSGFSAIHGQKHYNKPISDRVRNLIYNPVVEFFILRWIKRKGENKVELIWKFKKNEKCQKLVTFRSKMYCSPPTSLIDLWTEFGVISEKRHSTNLDPLLMQHIDPISVSSGQTAPLLGFFSLSIAYFVTVLVSVSPFFFSIQLRIHSDSSDRYRLKWTICSLLTAIRPAWRLSLDSTLNM